MPSNSALLILLLSLPFVGSVVAAFLPTNARNVEAWCAALVALVALTASILLYPAVTAGGIVKLVVPWIPSFGLDFTLRLDGFAWLFTTLVTGIGLLVVIYARYYLSAEDPTARFFSFLLAFMGAMLGIVTAGNLIQLVFFWELTSLFSFLLIGYWHFNQHARDGARMAVTITTAGGLSLFAGVLVLGHIVGSYDLDAVLASGTLVRDHALYRPALVLVVLGALTKSAQFPFHFWLPHAMAAPTPVSAYLHSATMVKAGVFLLALLWPVLSGTREWTAIVGVAGLVTLVLGAYFAACQQDLKGLLAYSTISHLGLITLLLGLGSPLAAVAAVFHMVNHATFKASLFMAAGIVDHETGTRNMRQLTGLYRSMPFTATLAMVAAASMAGVPLMNGFLSKEMFYAETIETHTGSLVDQSLPYVALLWGILSVVYSLRFIHGVFFGPAPQGLPRQPHEPAFWMRFPVVVLVIVCLVVGILPALTIGPFLTTAVTAVLGAATPEFSLKLWHGFTTPLLMSVLALALGTLVYVRYGPRVRTMRDGPPLLRGLKGQRIFEKVLVTVSWRWARVLENLFGTRNLQPQLQLLVAVALVAAALPFVGRGLLPGTVAQTPLSAAFALLWALGAVCAVGAAWIAKYHRFAALALMGGAGFVSSITFMWLSAPDLALTQLVIETVTVVLILLGLRWLPKRVEGPALAHPPLRVRVRRARDLLLAIAAGTGAAALAYAVMTRPLPDSVSRFFVERAYPGAGGTNVVNTIIVDFRALDTYGEAAVLATVALSVYALLRRFRPAADTLAAPAPGAAPAADDGFVPALVVRALFPVIGLVATYLFLRGHDAPGGGFIAGLTMSIAILLLYIAYGTRWVEARLRIFSIRWIGWGLLIAVATGLGAWLFGHPFLTSHMRYAGGVPLATAMAFDFGVFMVVVGATVLMLVALGHQSTRSLRQPEAGS